MAAAAGVSYSSVQRIWHAHGLKPHLVRTFKVSRDRNFVTKVEDVVGLYLNPPDKALVLCVDEKSQIQALDRTQFADIMRMRGRIEQLRALIDGSIGAQLDDPDVAREYAQLNGAFDAHILPLVDAAVAAGGRPVRTEDYGGSDFMYGPSYADLDGHIWEIMWMDVAAAQRAGAFG